MVTKMYYKCLFVIVLLAVSTECSGQYGRAAKAFKQLFKNEAKSTSMSFIERGERKTLSKYTLKVSSWSRKEIERIASNLSSSNRYQNIKVSPDLLEDVKLFCERNGRASMEDVENVLKELDIYSNFVLLEEKRFLKNHMASLSVEQKNYYDRLNRLYPKEGRILDISYLPSRVELTHALPDCISIDRWVHIALKHGTKRYDIEKEKGKKIVKKVNTYFHPNFFENITKEIPDIIKKPSYPPIKSGDNFLYIREYQHTVGFNKDGKEIKRVFVYTNKEGKVVTSFPPTDEYFKKEKKLPYAQL